MKPISKKNNNIILNTTPLPKQIKGYLSYLSSIKGASPQTINGYRTDLILFFRFLKIHYGLVPEDSEFENISISDIDNNFIKEITLPDLYMFLEYLETERNNVGTTRARKVAALKSFLRYMYHRAKILESDLSSELETPKISRKLPIYLSVEESILLMNSVTSRNKERDEAIITMFLNTGMRLSELCGIDMNHIKGDELLITGKGNKQRMIYLNDACMSALNRYLKVKAEKYPNLFDKGPLFLSEQKRRINKRTVEDVVNKAIESAGLSSKYSVHKLRHTAATHIYRQTSDIRSVQIILGHESISTTQLYTHVDKEKIKETMKLNPLNM